MAAQFLIFQECVCAAFASHARELFERTDQDQFGCGAGLLDGNDRPANPDAHWLHVRHYQFGEELRGLSLQVRKTAYRAYHFELGPATNEMPNDA